MLAPTCCPSAGVCLPVDFVEAIDGDTQKFRIRQTQKVVNVRLIDTWCHELTGGTEETRRLAQEAKQFASDRLRAADVGDLKLWIPFAHIAAGESFDIFRLLSFNRVLGYVFIGPVQTLNRMMVDARLASTRKGGELGR